MKPLPRPLRIALLLLAFFFAGVAAVQWWLQRETEELQEAALATRRAELAEAVALAESLHAPWSDAFLQSLGGALAGRVTVITVEESRHPPVGGGLAVEAPLPSQAGKVVRLYFTPLARPRLAILQRRALAASVIIGLLLLVIAVVGALPQRGQTEGLTRTPWQRSESEMDGLTRLARLTAERGALLAQETGARQRAEQDRDVSRDLLTRSHEERVRLGRELHDNICQTLYAVSLSLESVGRRVEAEPEVAQRLTQCIGELRRLNHEVRTHLRELEPGEVQRQSFEEALRQMLDTGPAGPEVRVVRQLDEFAVGSIAPDQAIDVLNILREAISNAVRHGRPHSIVIRAERDQSTVALAVQDDGCGFPAGEGNGQGHGLANMRARASGLGGSLRVESAPGKGSRVLLLVPVASPS
ncbi:MAG TPA: ATP-binding protein [Candidatus Didemnitutus sp.]|nr:ATP-binding protein [Candidatus Didemnitutus sp.]